MKHQAIEISAWEGYVVNAHPQAWLNGVERLFPGNYAPPVRVTSYCVISLVTNAEMGGATQWDSLK